MRYYPSPLKDSIRCFHDPIALRKKSARISSSARNQCTINPRWGSNMAREQTRLLPVLHLILSFATVVDPLLAPLLSRTYLSVSRRLRKIAGNRIIHFRRKFHVSVPHCATSPSGAFSGTAVRFRPRRKRNRKSRPLQMYAHPE